MIKVSVMYPNSAEATFDIDYYCNTHVPLVVSLLGDALKAGAVDHGIAGGAPGEAPAFIAMGHLTFDSVEAFQQSFGPNADEILGDLPNFTNVQPTIQISEIKI
ncbi:MAG: EthD family reductase [Gammaproteobacteria bacterium]|nr:MAG: EthD family reductase [Gammaproteobacteria bacterium]